jgi:MraZ protein
VTKAVAVSGIFSGPALTAIDDKGRLAIPALLRNSIAAADGEDRILCITKHERAPCLIAFGVDRLEGLLQDIEREEATALARGEAYDRDSAQRRKFGRTENATLDKSGRFLLPGHLRAAANIGSSVFLYGAGRHFELWDVDTLMAADDSYADIKDVAAWFLESAGKKK